MIFSGIVTACLASIARAICPAWQSRASAKLAQAPQL